MAQKSYKDQLMELYGQQTTGTAQTGAGQRQSNAMLDLILSRKPFSYDAKTDPAAQAVRKQTARNAHAVTQDTLGQYAGMTGGVPSTAAVSAAAQAGNQATAAGADKIAELQQLAYNNYQQEGQNMQNAYGMLQQQETDAYNREQTEYEKQYNLALLKAQYGDYSGLKELGVDTSKYTAGGGYSGYGGSGSGSGGSGSGNGGGGGPTDEDYDRMLSDYPGKVLTEEQWAAEKAKYGEDQLIAWGFTKKAKAQSGGGTTKKNPTMPAKPGENMLN